jgi:hypothetical protein
MKTFLNNLNSRYISNVHLGDKNLCHYKLRSSVNHHQAGKIKFISTKSTRSALSNAAPAIYFSGALRKHII